MKIRTTRPLRANLGVMTPNKSRLLAKNKGENMAFRINTNITALNNHNNARKTDDRLNASLNSP